MSFGYEEFTMSQNAANDRVRKAQEEDKAYQRARQEKMDASLASMLSGTGGVGSAPTDNRFSSGLSDVETRLRALLDNPDSIQQTGAYKFRVGQGQEALQRSLGAKGLLNSGNRLMELTEYGQDMGAQEYDAQAGRLSNLLGTYGQGYVADKNANTSLFSATESAKANANRNALGWANLNWDMSKPQSGGGVSRSSSGMNAGNLNLGGIGGSWNPDTDPTIQRMRRDDGWNYDYSQGGNSLWRNSATGESTWSPGGREGNPSYGR
mgnify:CR=1 FL=1